VKSYLCAYTTIMRGNERARFFRTFYIDAFAGTGSRTVAGAGAETAPLFADVDSDEEALRFAKGSAAIALEVEPPFDRYVFIENDPAKLPDLESLVDHHPDRKQRVSIVEGDANDALSGIVDETDWRGHRAVVFLDPYGMSVDWTTIEALAGTRAVDLWLLFPLGQAVNRLLVRKGLPPAGFAERLTRAFGTDAWKEAFYAESTQQDLFESRPEVEKVANFNSIAAFFRDRLESVFYAVSPHSLKLVNSRNNPLFLLCFAASNEKGAKTAIKIANDVLRV